MAPDAAGFAFNAENWDAEGGEEVDGMWKSRTMPGTGAKTRTRTRMETRARGEEVGRVATSRVARKMATMRQQEEQGIAATLLALQTATAGEINSYSTPAPETAPTYHCLLDHSPSPQQPPPLRGLLFGCLQQPPARAWLIFGPKPSPLEASRSQREEERIAQLAVHPGNGGDVGGKGARRRAHVGFSAPNAGTADAAVARRALGRRKSGAFERKSGASRRTSAAPTRGERTYYRWRFLAPLLSSVFQVFHSQFPQRSARPRPASTGFCRGCQQVVENHAAKGDVVGLRRGSRLGCEEGAEAVLEAAKRLLYNDPGKKGNKQSASQEF
ncbi:hypothetical protein BDK51DRAFT_41305 [Blyttiomyces helicus]|uniref:Uncharacterized protein n=1 Tax=Blyttiomyces helicus TaxID=388810 RepID=A0A4P9VWX5_9FUNG|nr:hypothetical protein BDK51DRAFT_41305 [Blyttiomyces helicus]|eukprot:RKO83712.1 hypothetical protein BDK51DRAFT_41305 [Blyttiomyces helicus]